MARESTIRVYRSSSTSTPTGLTFGELAYSDVAGVGRLFIGTTAGNSLWIGAGVTTTDISGNSTVLVPTQSAVKSYVDGVVGGGSVVNSVNASSGSITITGDGGAIVNSQSGTSNTVGARLATTGVTGVASFNSSYFSVASGAVSLASAYQVTGDTVIQGTGITVSKSGNGATISNNGVVTFNGNTGTVVYAPPVATTGVTGVASFSSSNFDVASGAVSIKSGGVSNTNLANSSITFTSGGGSSPISLGGTLNVTGAANQVAITNSSGTITVGLANDVTIPGNLTVNGTVVTANVDSFVVEDSLIMLGTGNAADSLDLGFYGQYTSSGKRFAGIYRDASDSGKFKFFDNLTGNAEPTTFVNDSGADYAVATIVAKIDGGTF